MPDAIIKPMRTAGCPKLGPLALMISTRVDLKVILEDASGCLVAAKRSPLMSGLFVSDEGDGMSVIGPMMGAPYAAALLETIIAWGAQRVLFLGWCGAISPGRNIGDIIVPTGGLIDEGTSLHYGGANGEAASAAQDARRQIKQMLSGQGLPYHEGPVWTTDAPYRETPKRWKPPEIRAPSRLRWRPRPCSPWAATERRRWGPYCWYPMTSLPLPGGPALKTNGFAPPAGPYAKDLPSYAGRNKYQNWY